jgi:AAA domain/UvrD-like helicase C-terminal domain
VAALGRNEGMGLEATEEQRAARDAFASGIDLALIAGAGTGKTSTLMMMAEATRKRGLYMAFNKATAVDAARRFGRNVNCRTAHSLAFAATGRKFRGRLNAPRIPARGTARLLGITSEIIAGPDRITPAHQARLVTGMIRGFCFSSATEVQARHLEAINGLSQPEQGEVAALLLPYAAKAWEDLSSPSGKLRFEHDHYMKMWALTRPILPGEFIFLDEAQDTNPVLEEIFLAQRAQRVCVGDPAQQIYAWRSARDIMSGFPARHLELTRSFRFGPRIAETANRWLRLAESSMRLTGAGPARSRIGQAAAADAVLCRNNADVMTEVLAFLRDGVPVAVSGGGDVLRTIAEAAQQLKAGRRTSHPELFLFRNWGEVQEYAEHDTAGQDLRAIVQLIDMHGPETIISAVERLSPEDLARVTVTTAHKAKGREWPSVRIGPGFDQPPVDDDGRQRPLSTAEARLIYVAVTRARVLLDPAGIAWADEYEQALGEPASLGDLPLTAQLKFHNSPVSLFLDTNLPDAHRAVSDYQRQIAGLPRPVLPGNVQYPAWSALGHALDYRLRLFLGCSLGDPVRAGVQAVGSGEPLRGAPCRAARAALAAAGEKLLDVLDRYLAGRVRLTEDQVSRLCFVAASYEDVYRTADVRRYSLLADASPDTGLRELAAAVPDYVTGDITRQLALALPVFEPFRAGHIVCGPVFAGSADIGGADADFIVGGLLLDCKATTRPERLGAEEIYQLAGYLLLDYHDEYRIGRVGLYLSRQGATVCWGVPEFLGLLGAREPLPTLRTRFRQFLEAKEP